MARITLFSAVDDKFFLFSLGEEETKFFLSPLYREVLTHPHIKDFDNELSCDVIGASLNRTLNGICLKFKQVQLLFY